VPHTADACRQQGRELVRIDSLANCCTARVKFSPSVVGRSVGASNENYEKKTGDLVRPQIFLNAAVPLLSRDVVCRQGETQKVGPRSFAKYGNGYICYLFIYFGRVYFSY
jgi:hypothetical protein